MRKFARRTLVALLCAAAAAAPTSRPAAAAGADDIVGIWDSEEKTSKIEVVRCGDAHCGDIVWLKEPEYPPGAKDGVPGTPFLDHNNPSQDLRRTPLLGLRIMRGFTFSDGGWSGGTIYDPKDGKTYRGRMNLASPTRLKLRGYVGIPLFGRTSHWTREAP